MSDGTPAMKLESASPEERIEDILSRVRHWLPDQGPIQVFIHHNTLHSLEEMSFENAVEHASRVLKAEPYLTHEAFVREYRRGRIDEAGISAALDREIRLAKVEDQTLVERRFARRTIWKALLEIPDLTAPDATIEWMVNQTGDRALWAVVARRWNRLVEKSPAPAPVVWSAVNEALAALAAAYLDQGISYWPMPHRELGFLESFRRLWRKEVPPGEAHAVMAKHLESVPGDQWESYLLTEALSLPGWAGTFALLEQRPTLLRDASPKASFAEFMAVRLSLKSFEKTTSGEETSEVNFTLARAFTVYRLLTTLAVGEKEAEAWKDSDWLEIINEVQRFGDLARRRVLHQAYEEQFNRNFFGSILMNRALNGETRIPNPKYQAVFCIDEREESLRRHLEEIETDFETLSVAGFFAVDMWYQGLGEPAPVPLCPVMITPKHIVRETPRPSHSRVGQKKVRRRRAAESLGSLLYDHSRALIVGWWFAAVAGFAAAWPMFLRTLFPAAFSRWNRYLASIWFPHVETNLSLARESETSEPAQESPLFAGYTLDEMVTRVCNLLKAIGLTEGFAPLVFIVGHGSSSLNNPHESAYNCGACGGERGGPNARAFAQMANLPAVRAALLKSGIEIPESTWFVGGMHDTASDEVEFFDRDRIPAAKQKEFQAARNIFYEAQKRDAHERCRRFESAKGVKTPDQAIRHVEGRSKDFKEPRPECGHATNALCVVGGRHLTRQLYLDRRCFLSSYNPRIDPDGSILAGILGAVIPVCAGINLEYYFSFVDNEVYGCGSKLPHNITSLIGVMNGRVSDLRTGLPWQMVEIHEPVRILFIIEAERWKLERLIESNREIARLVKNRWVQLAVVEPGAEGAEIFQEGRFVPVNYPSVPLNIQTSSRAHYEGKIEHLWPARIEGRGR